MDTGYRYMGVRVRINRFISSSLIMKYTITIEHRPWDIYPYYAIYRKDGEMQDIACAETAEEAEKDLVEKLRTKKVQSPIITKEIEI